MKLIKLTSILLVLGISPAMAQETNKTLAATMDVYVFPKKGQEAEQQSKDEAACFEWATSNTGTDPFALAKQEQEDQKNAQREKQAAAQAGRGSGGGGAIAGAAAGALIGEIANDDASEGAAWGAAAGMIRGRRMGAEARQQAQAQASGKAEQREQLTADQLANFKKAFSVCLEAKEYLVKY